MAFDSGYAHRSGTGIRRETISGYLKAAGIPARGRGRPSESKPKPAISSEVSTDPGPSNRDFTGIKGDGTLKTKLTSPTSVEATWHGTYEFAGAAAV